jgi:hypothetical protein
MALLSFGFLTAFASQIILVWTDSAFPLAAWTLQVLAPAFVAKSLTGMGTASLRGRGTVGLEVRFNLVVFVATWGLLIPVAVLLSTWGPLVPGWLWQPRLLAYRGFVLAAGFGLLLGSLWFVRSFARAESIEPARYLGAALLRPLAAVCPIVVVIASLQGSVSIPPLVASPRWALLIEICLWGVLYTFLASLSAWFFVLSRAERAALVDWIRARWHKTTGCP